MKKRLKNLLLIGVAAVLAVLLIPLTVTCAAEGNMPSGGTGQEYSSGPCQARVFDTGYAGLLLRTSPSMESGGNVVIPDWEILTISQESGGFGYTTYQGASGWVRLKYTQIVDDHSVKTPAGAATAPTPYTISNTNSAGLALRVSPTEDSSTYGFMMEGTEILIEAVENGWGYTSDYAGHRGWAEMAYLKPGSPSKAPVQSAAGVAFPYQVMVWDTGSYGLLVRTSPSTDAQGVVLIGDGEVISITQESGGFGYTSYKGQSGWVRLQFTHIIGNYPSQQPSGGIGAPVWYTVVNTENAGAAMRTRPDDDSSMFGYIMEGADIPVAAVEGNWGYIPDYAGHSGWVRMDCLSAGTNTGSDRGDNPPQDQEVPDSHGAVITF